MEKLIPFAQHPDPLEVHADLSLKGNLLEFRFELSDPRKIALDSLVPGSLAAPAIARADLLWKTTCFEAFWSVPGEKSYWELNVSATGRQWNCYSFRDYRDPALPSPSHDYEIQNVKVTSHSLEGSLLGKTELKKIEASLCVILRTGKGTRYYSKVHTRPEPNFHSRASFVLLREKT